MNYYVFRFLLFILILGILFLINKFFIREQISKKMILPIFSIIMLFIILVPFEKFFLKFSSVESVFKYYFPGHSLIEKYEYDDYAYLLYFDNKSTSTFLYFKKNNGYWEYSRKYGLESKLGVYDDRYLVTISKIDDKDVTGVCIIIPKYLEKKHNVSDSLNSDFKEVVYDKGNVYAYIAIIDSDLTDEYTLIVNNKKFKPMKYNSFYNS